jgi:hypothetical protein
VITLDEARARGVALPLDDAVAQDIIDEQEAWLTSRIGLLEGARTETFFVGIPGTGGKLGLRRSTDAVTVVDNGNPTDPSLVRILDNGGSIELKVTSTVYPWWIGPYVTATYTPNDADRVRSALFALLGLALEPVSTLVSETIGAYSYTGGSIGSPAQARAIIVSSLKPRRDSLSIVSLAPPLPYSDPMINRRELPL